MPDQNDLNKPDLGSSYNNEVLETLRGHIARLWTGTWGSMAGVVNGMLRWEIPGGNVLKLWRRNGSGTDDLVFDSTSLLGDGTVTTPKLANGVLSADAAGRAKMADGFLSADAAGRAKMADGFLSADAAGRAKMADGFLSADAAGRAKMADWFVTPIKLSTGAPTWDTSGNLRVTASTGAIGYGTGAGGTVTQTTSKSTAVTLNRPTGLIVMNNASLAAGASVTFDVNNSLLFGNWLVLVSTAYVNYRVSVDSVSGNKFVVRVTNSNVIPLADDVNVNFALIRVSNT
jgi:hypothetical protein